MNRWLRWLPLSLVFLLAALVVHERRGGLWARDFLTDQEVTLMQNLSSIDRRVGVYMEAAALRLGTAKDRFEGKESRPGDALEFYSQDDMLDDYCEILEHVMLAVNDAFDAPRRRENINIKKALKTLKSEMTRSQERLAALKRQAEKARDEELWNRVNRAIDITGGVLDGAEEGLTRIAVREAREAEEAR